MPCVRLKKNRFRKSLNLSSEPTVGSSSSKSGAANCCVVERAGEICCRDREQTEPGLGERAPVDFGEPHLQQHLLALVAAGQLQHVDQPATSTPRRAAISATRRLISFELTLPCSTTASSFA